MILVPFNVLQKNAILSNFSEPVRRELIYWIWYEIIVPEMRESEV